MAKKKSSNFAGRVSSNAEKAKKAGASYGYLSLPKGVSVFSPEPGGTARFDILPYPVTMKRHPDRDAKEGVAEVGELWYKLPYKRHTNVGVNNESIVCPTSFGGKCPICEHRAKRIKQGADQEETNEMKAGMRNLYVVVPINNKKFEREPHIFDISHYNFQDQLFDEIKENPEHEIFPDLEMGETLKVRFAAKTIGNSQPFAQASRIDFVERDEQYDEDILEKVPNLDDVLIILSYDEIKEKFFEVSEEEDGGDLKEEEDDEEEEDEKPNRKRGKETPQRTKRPSKEEDEEEEDEEEEDEKPTRTKKKVVKEEEDDDEEEEETPKRKGKPVVLKCPHGGKFGKDFDTLEACDDCDLWNECAEKSEG